MLANEDGRRSQPLTFMKNLSVKAILIAFVADFGVTQILATPFSLVMMFAVPQARALMMGGNPTTIMTFLSNWPPFIVMGLVCACVGEVIGGLVAGLLAPLHPKLNAIATAIVAILFSLLLIGSYPLWYRVVSIALVVPCYHQGAQWAIRRNAAKAVRQPLAPEVAPLASPHH